jgi:hypothetical protein
MTSNDSDEVVATKPKPKRKMKARSKWKRYRRPGKGELKSEAELARALGEEQRTVRNWRYRGLIPYLSLGHRSIRYRLPQVLEALEKRQINKKRHFYQQRI